MIIAVQNEFVKHAGRSFFWQSGRSAQRKNHRTMQIGPSLQKAACKSENLQAVLLIQCALLCATTDFFSRISLCPTRPNTAPSPMYTLISSSVA